MGGTALNCTRGLLVGASLLAGAALQTRPVEGANTPQIGAVPAWVLKAPDLAAEKADLKELPVTILLNDTQFSFDSGGWSEFHEVRAKVQAASGLQSLGALPFQWSPWSDTLTFHHASIVRDGRTIDVLPKDGVFTVLRRETGLEQAMLTGELTALLQPEGLQVGDILDIAVSIRHADPLLKARTAALFAGWDGTPVGHLRIEAHWPSSLHVRWQETADLPPLRQTEAGGVTTAALDVEDIRPPVPPAHAPARFQHGREVEFTNLADWKEVAQIMAPLYAKAAELTPKSPVAVQAKLIAKISTDPKARAGAALQLVQGEVRYLAHTEASGSYTPQSADETWRLRYGDCKAKTSLLLALLQELGVPAAPVLANTTWGDSLAGHLPSALVFNHVLVRVTLGQKIYWLDGARQGDRNLDDLTTPAYGWVLPLDTTDGRLVHLVPAPSTKPQMLQVIRYDASGGVTAPEPTELQTTFRGDAGALLHAQLSAVPPERMDAALKAYWSGVHTAFTATHVSASWDPATSEERLVADGTSKLDWSGAGLELQHVELGGPPEIKRDPASRDPDAPYVVDFPSYIETDESVVLPPGVNLSAEIAKAADFDAVIAGVAYHRSGTVTGHTFRVVASQRTLQPEISAAEARASVDPLTKLGQEGVYAPAGAFARAANDAAAIDTHPATVDGHLDRGNALLNAARFKDALSEFDAAIALDPKSQLAWADRAVAHAWLADPAATADADKADALGPPEIVAARARGILATKTGDPEAAQTAYRRALTLAPNDTFVLGKLIYLELRKSDLAAARTDLDRLVKSHPELAQNTHLWRASIERMSNHKEGAERELAQAPTTTSEEFLDRAAAYLDLGDKALARTDLDASIRIKPSIVAWLLRASTDGGMGSAAADADVEAAAQIAPDDVGPQLREINAAYARRDFAAAVPLITHLEKAHPELGNLPWYALRSKANSAPKEIPSAASR